MNKVKNDTVNNKVVKFQKPKRKVLKKKRYRLKPEAKLCLFILGISIVFIVLSFTVFFKIDNIYITGCEKYDSQEIIKASEIKEGSNILLLNKFNVGKNIYDAFPYIENVEVKKRLPSSVEIIIKNQEVDFALQLSDGYLLISKKDRILEKLEDKPEDVLIVSGVQIGECKEGNDLAYETEDLKDAVCKLRDAIKDNEFYGINMLNMTNQNNIIIEYESRINIVLGNIDDLEYKIMTAKEILEKKIGKFEKGTLNVSSVKVDNRSYFKADQS